MKQLTLVRHAQADNPLPDQRDWDRPLTKRGLLDAREMARRMKERSLRPELILSSPAIRAAQTAEVFAKCFAQAKLLMAEELYLASAKQMLAAIHEHGAAVGHLMVVGHNPGISEFADELSHERSIDGMPTSGIVTVDFELSAWRELHPGEGCNVEFDYPQRPA
ncbi:MAG: histidine phosphatase family protein [Steroidobacteraceae bacterium]